MKYTREELQTREKETLITLVIALQQQNEALKESIRLKDKVLKKVTKALNF